MMTKEEELRLIQRVLAGDKNAYEPLVLEHQTRVYNLALRILATRPTHGTPPRRRFCAPTPLLPIFAARVALGYGCTG